MSTTFIPTNSHSDNCHVRFPAQVGRLDQQTLAQALHEVHEIVPPLWPLADYVAVNPCFGLVDQSLLGAHLTLSNLRDCHLLMPREYFQALYHDGPLSSDDLAACTDAMCR